MCGSKKSSEKMLVFVGSYLHTHALPKRVHDPLKPHPVELFAFLHYISLKFFFRGKNIFSFDLTQAGNIEKLVQFLNCAILSKINFTMIDTAAEIAAALFRYARFFSIYLFIFHTFINSLIVCINTKICIKISIQLSS